MNNLAEFFQDDAGRLSMTRLLCFISIFPASYVVVKKPDVEILSSYLFAYVVSYLGGKATDAYKERKINARKLEADKKL